jgi:hypothetical protein
VLGLRAGQSPFTSLKIATGASTPLGSFSFNVIGTDGAVTDQIVLSLKVFDFNVSVSPASVQVVSGGSTNLSVTIGALGGWTDQVDISCGVTPTVQGACAGMLGTLLPGTSPLSYSATGYPAGDYNLTLMGTSSGITHKAPAIVLHVGGASGSVSPGSATISVGGTANFSVILTSKNGYTDQFTFGCPGLPSGLNCMFSPTSGNLPANGTLTSTLTLSVVSKPAAVTKPISIRPRGPEIWPYLTAILGWLVTALLLWQNRESS